MATVESKPATAADNASTSADTPAVSARILKKRETDRKCQRMIRERTKSRIAYLESLVEQFREQDPSGRVETLMKQLTDLRQERDVLVKKVKNIENIISDGKMKDEPDLHELSLASLRRTSVGETPLSSSSQRTACGSQSPPDDGPPDSQDFSRYTVYNKEYAAYLEAGPGTEAPASTLHPKPHRSGQCECSTHPSMTRSGEIVNKWRYANETLTEWFKWPSDVLDMQDYFAYNDDIPVRAIVEGWDAVEAHGHMHPAWRLLRGIDENMFGSLESRERLALLQLAAWMLLSHINPTREQHMKLPSFYLKRPSQDMLHSYAIEYLAWPSLRERFLYSEHRYCTATFWELFNGSLRVSWPYEFRDCYTLNVDTGLYKISPTFNERISDIRSWTMGMEMFKQYPELYSDMPTWNHIPASMSSRSTMNRSSRKALPPPSLREDPDSSRKGREYERRGSQAQPVHQMQGLMSAMTPAPTVHCVSQNPCSYPSSSHGTCDMITSPLSGSFDYGSATLAATVAGMQQTSMLNGWDYVGGTNFFPVNTA